MKTYNTRAEALQHETGLSWLLIKLFPVAVVGVLAAGSVFFYALLTY